jgi:hypothetical protein
VIVCVKSDALIKLTVDWRQRKFLLVLVLVDMLNLEFVRSAPASLLAPSSPIASHCNQILVAVPSHIDCVRECVRACVCVCVRARVCVCVSVSVSVRVSV